MFKALNNLLLLYARERSRNLLDNSMAIACALGDKLLQAHCLRYVNLIEQPGPFAEFCLRGAAQRFKAEECYDHANYCLNNMLVGRFYSEISTAEDFRRLIEESASLIPNFRGVGIIYNNAGISHLFDGRLEEAVELFEAGMSKPNMLLHQIGLEVNRIIAMRLDGYLPDGEEVLRLAERAKNRIDSRYRFQLAEIYLNLLLAVKEGSEIARDLRRILEEGEFLADPQVLTGGQSLRVLLGKLGFRNTPEQAPPGLRGKFVQRYGFAPIMHYAWL